MTHHYSKQLCLPPEGSDERRTATHAFKSPDSMIAQFGERLRTEVGKLMVLPIPPYVLHGIELGGISRQVLQMNRAPCAWPQTVEPSGYGGFWSDPKSPTTSS